MPSVFLTAFNSAEPVPIFSKKGIAYLMPGKPSAPSVFVQTAEYFFYPYAFLQMAIICCVTKLVTTIDSGFSAIFKGIKVPFVFNQPTATFRFGKLDPEQVTNLKAMGLVQDLTSPFLFVGSPGPEHLATIWRMKPVEDRIRPGHIGADGYFAWTYLIKGVQAFITARNNTDGRANLRYSLKQSVKFDQEGDILRVGKEIFKGKHGFSSGRSIITTNDIFLHPPAMDLSGLPGQVTQLQDAKAMSDDSIGFFFPYFPGMNVPDKDLAGDVFSRLFPNLLSGTFNGNQTIMRQVCSGNRALCFSDAGMALSHIYRVFDISMSVPDVSLAIVVRNHAYQGTIMLCHPDVRLQMYGKIYTPGPVNEDIRKIDLLDSQAEKIVALLGGAMEIDGVVKRVYQPSEFLTSRRALRSWNTINRMAYAASDILKEVKSIISKMEFSDSYAPVTVKNVQLALTAMVTKDFTHLESFPAYLGGTVLNDSSSVTEALSMFGSQAPTINMGVEKNSTTISIPASDKPDTNLVKVDGIRPLRYLPVYAVPQGLACQQWTAIFSSGYLRIPAGRKEKKEFANLHRAITQISTDEDLGTAYNCLKQMCDEARASAKAGGKRKRQDGESSGIAKRARAMESDTLDDL